MTFSLPSGSDLKATGCICSNFIALPPLLNDRQLRHALPGKRAGLAIEMIFKFFAKLFDEGDGRHRGRVAERAESAAQHVLGEVLHVVDVAGRAKTCVEARERFLEPVSAFAA